MRLAMWSGPRNLSTALMRSFENRPDTDVLDEPLYAHYLSVTGLEHPLRQAVIAAGPASAGDAVRRCLAPVPAGRMSYQKHMSHHLLEELGVDWLDALTHAFLIRHPRAVVASYARTRAEPTLADLGFVQQRELFDRTWSRTGRPPPVIACEDVLEDPRRTLTRLCESVGIAFSEQMLQWPAGPRDSDGVWAPAWYASVERSTGFGAPRTPAATLSPRLEALVALAMPHFAHLSRHAL